ncbi:hypothetical protein WMY93_003371 [Mugilogobius chulae]|uniref:Ig-like domain-containing protein n=1 Tax=Mugilogobius chulae TaxID=88201 RepID=A0AAW0PXA0_9GOBI
MTPRIRGILLRSSGFGGEFECYEWHAHCLSLFCNLHGDRRRFPWQPASRLVLPPRNARVTLGGDARLEGKVHGHPEPQVTWYKEGRPVIGGERRIIRQNGRGMFSLVVGGVTAEDLGCYTCQATNQAGSRQVTVEILLDESSNKKYGLPSSLKTGCRSAVPAAHSGASIWGESPPRFITKPSRICAKAGQTVKFSAKTTGRPQPQVSWQRGEAELENGGRVSMYERSGLHFLEIKEACAEDGGSYTCVVSNSAGSTTATAELSVQVSSGESTRTEQQSDVTHSSLLSTASSPTDQPLVSKEEVPQSCSRARPAVQLPPVAPRRTATQTKVQSAVNPSSAPLQAMTSSSDNNKRSVRKTLSGSELRFEAVPLNQEATEGAQVTFTCQVSSAAFSSVTWLKDVLLSG